MAERMENVKHLEVITTEDLHRISSYFFKYYTTTASTHVDAVYFFLTYLNGDRAAEKAKLAKVKNIKVLNFITPTSTIQYLKRSVIKIKTSRHGIKNTFAVIPKADDTDETQPFTVIMASQKKFK